VARSTVAKSTAGRSIAGSTAHSPRHAGSLRRAPTGCKTSKFSRRIHWALAALALSGSLGVPARAEDSRSRYQAQYDAEGDPVRKAKILAKLGPLEISEARTNVRSEKDEQALAALEKYRDEVRKTAEDLTATGVDAQRRPAGFKELQISLRESIRHLDDLILSLPVDERETFQAVRSDLSATQNLLFDALFPSGKGSKGDQRSS
jgi:hypothetical protein